jgi:RNA polymerase sigma-70 factor (ECF subfamily)
VEEISERELIARLRRRDPRALVLAYERCAPRVYAFLLRLVGSRELAEDLFQESWLKLARGADTLSPQTELLAWLFTVGRNAFYSHVRKHARAVPLEDDLELPHDGHLPDGEMLAGIEVARLEAALQKLSVIDREVLLLVGVEGLSHERAAEVLSLEAAAFRKRLSRARTRFRTLLDGEPVSLRRSSS